MSVAGFVLGLIATVLAVASLGWQAATLLGQRPRPKLTAVVGRLTPEGLVTNDASGDVRESLVEAAGQLEDIPLIVGVKVVNAGGSPFHVAGWAVRSDPDGTSLMPVKKPIAGAEIPHDVPPGGSAVFLTELRHAHRLARTDGHIDTAEGLEGRAGSSGQPPRIVLTVSSGARTYATKPIAPEIVSLA
jgi:hypothetical protein